MSLKITRRPSPNFDERNAAVDTIVLHYTGMTSATAALDRLCDPAAKVSAHYLVDDAGAVFARVEEDKRAWHAGVSSWRGEANVNARSVGVEIANPGHEWGYAPFPDAQIDAVVALVGEIARRWAVAPGRGVGHADVAPRRKEDPGELFPWERRAEARLAVGRYSGEPDPTIDYDDALIALRAVGYDAPPGDHAAAVLAFQRRFCPAALGMGLDPLTKAALVWASGETRET
ncbi:MAG: N-acetylmuramoyl-L-alanine amidase [Parvularculaceae bacterium]